MVVRSIDYKNLFVPDRVEAATGLPSHGTGWKPYAFEIEDEEEQFSVLVKGAVPATGVYSVCPSAILSDRRASQAACKSPA